MSISLDISFKGARSYLHGSDIFSALSVIGVDLCNSPDAFVKKLTFRHFAKTKCELLTERPECLDNVMGQVVFFSPEKKMSREGWIVETGQPVISRRAFDEEALLAESALDVDSKTNRLKYKSGYTAIEMVIAATKQLNYRLNGDVTGQWVFGQLEMSEPLPETGNFIEIQTVNIIKNRFSVNHICVDGHPVGVMRFIVGAP